MLNNATIGYKLRDGLCHKFRMLKSRSMISQKTQGQIFHKRKAVPTPDSVKHKLRSTQGALPKVNVDAQKALDTAGSAFKIKIVVYYY